MTNRMNIAYILGIIALVVLPTAITLGYYQATKNPNLRPLSVTQQALHAYARDKPARDQVNIAAQVEWVAAQSGGYSRAGLEQALVRAFKAKGVEVFVFFHDGVDRTRITYVVGQSRIGPYSTSQAAYGITAAVAAYRMQVPVN